MRNFDEERGERAAKERSLRAGGQEFTYKASVAPEVIIRWNSAVNGEMPEE